MTKPVVISLMGPTAVGKTDLAIELFSELKERLPIDIISVDSAMVYRGLDIGTGKPSLSVLNTIPHRLVDIRDPYEIYTVADFCQDAIKYIKQAHLANRVPLLVGGTMMYFKSLQSGLAKLPSSNLEIREGLYSRLNKHGLESLYHDLATVDPIAANKLNSNDTQRIIRALEVYYISGKKMSELLRSDANLEQPNLFCDYYNINLIMAPQSRAFLHASIANRFHKMLASGFVDEVAQLMQNDKININLPAVKSCGYQQIWQYLLGNITEAEMTEKSIVATRQLAKRQLTWLRSWQGASWFDITEDNFKLALKAKIESCFD